MMNLPLDYTDHSWISCNKFIDSLPQFFQNTLAKDPVPINSFNINAKLLIKTVENFLTNKNRALTTYDVVFTDFPGLHTQYDRTNALIFNIHCSENTYNTRLPKKAEYTEAGEILTETLQSKIYISKAQDQKTMLVYRKQKVITFVDYLKLKVLYYNTFFPGETVTEFYKSILNKDQETFDKFISETFDLEAIKAEVYKKACILFNHAENNACTDLENKITHTKDEIRKAINFIAEHTNKLKELECTLEAAKNQPSNTDAILKFLLNNPYIVSIDKNDNKLVLVIKAPIKYFDKYVLEKTIEHNKKQDNTNYVKILEILNNTKYELWAQTAVKFDIAKFDVSNNNSALEHYNMGLIRHPHISTFGCFGNHSRAIKDWIYTRNYEGAITQIIGAAMNLNYKDSTVIYRLLDSLTHLNELKTFKDTETDEFKSLKEILHEETEIEE